MKSKKIFTVTLAICMLFSIATGCVDFINYKEYEFKRPENNTSALLIYEDKAYSTRKSPVWWPNAILGEKQKGIGVYSGIVGECSGGYIFLTTSDSCLYVDGLNGTQPYVLYLNNIIFPELSAENVEQVQIVAYANKGFDDKEDGPNIDVTEYKEKILEIYQDEKNYVTKYSLDHTNCIGDIVLQCKQDHGLFKTLAIYTDNVDYYFFVDNFGDNGAMTCVKCNEIIPDGIEEFISYRIKKFGF